MEQLKKVSQSLDGCLSSIQDALDALEQIGEDNQLSAEICEAISERIFNVLDELDVCDEFIKKLNECKREDEMKAIINIG